MESRQLTELLKAEAGRLGFALAGAAPAVASPGYERFSQWLSAGYAGQMHYLPDRRDAYGHPQHVLDRVRSILMLGMSYHTESAAPCGEGQGRVASYAWSEIDYHDVIHGRLKQLIERLHQKLPDARARGVVDTAPLLEREFAQLAGLGWVGKNTLLLNKQQGSYFFLAALLTDVELQYDRPFAADHCGTCRACLDACPTDAFPEPYVLDATKCISYLTIELREAIPTGLREGVGDWLFGCDVCQQVCPWNDHASPSGESVFAPLPQRNPVDLIALMQLDDDAFRQAFRKTPLWCAKRRGVLRNAAIVLGNHPTPAALPALERGLNDEEPLVRGACAWALGRYDDQRALAALEERCIVETDEAVATEIAHAQRRQRTTVQNTQPGVSALRTHRPHNP